MVTYIGIEPFAQTQTVEINQYFQFEAIGSSQLRRSLFAEESLIKIKNGGNSHGRKYHEVVKIFWFAPFGYLFNYNSFNVIATFAYITL